MTTLSVSPVANNKPVMFNVFKKDWNTSSYNVENDTDFLDVAECYEHYKTQWHLERDAKSNAPQIEAAKSEATNEIEAATNDETPTPTETPTEEQKAAEKAEGDAMANKKAFVLGLLAECKTKEGVLDVALNNAPFFAAFKKGESVGMKPMIYELHNLGFSVEQILGLKIYDKDEKLAIMSIKDAIAKSKKGDGTITKSLTPEQLEARKLARTNRAVVIVQTSADIALEISQYEVKIEALKIRFVELQESEKAEAEADKIEKRASALKALTDLGISIEVAEGILTSQGK